jgi:hypothetical protein
VDFFPVEFTKHEGLQRQSVITDTEALVKHCCSQLRFGRWKDVTVHKKPWAQKFWEKDRLQEVAVLQSTDPNLSVYYFYTFFSIEYLWRPSRWSLNGFYKYMVKTPIQRNRTPNHFHATLLSSYQLICREEWQCDFKINGCRRNVHSC